MLQFFVGDAGCAGVEQVIREIQAAWGIRATGNDDGILVTRGGDALHDVALEDEISERCIVGESAQVEFVVQGDRQFLTLKFSPNIFSGNKLFGGVNKFAPAAAGCECLPIPGGWSREKAIATFKPLTADQVGVA